MLFVNLYLVPKIWTLRFVKRLSLLLEVDLIFIIFFIISVKYNFIFISVN